MNGIYIKCKNEKRKQEIFEELKKRNIKWRTGKELEEVNFEINIPYPMLFGVEELNGKYVLTYDDYSYSYSYNYTKFKDFKKMKEITNITKETSTEETEFKVGDIVEVVIDLDTYNREYKGTEKDFRFSYHGACIGDRLRIDEISEGNFNLACRYLDNKDWYYLSKKEIKLVSREVENEKKKAKELKDYKVFMLKAQNDTLRKEITELLKERNIKHIKDAPPFCFTHELYIYLDGDKWNYWNYINPTKEGCKEITLEELKQLDFIKNEKTKEEIKNYLDSKKLNYVSWDDVEDFKYHMLYNFTDKIFKFDCWGCIETLGVKYFFGENTYNEVEDYLNNLSENEKQLAIEILRE